MDIIMQMCGSPAPKIGKTQAVLLSIVILAISGCVSNTAPTTTSTAVPTVPTIDPIPAYNAITQAQSFYQTVHSDFSTASATVNEAMSKGVETSSSSALVASLQNKLSNAANVLNTALSAYNSQNYPQAKSYAEQSLALMQEIQSQLGQINQAVQNDYIATAAKYKPQLIEAERQYRIGQKYIEAVQKAGVDISSQQTRLQGVITTLNQAKDSYRNNNFIGLSGQINTITSTSQQVQGELTDLYYNALIVDAAKKVEAQVTVQEAKNYLSDASSLRQEKKYPDSVLSLNKALIIETQAAVSVNVDKLKQAVRSMGFEPSFPELDNKLNSIRLQATSGNFDAAEQEIEATKTDVMTTTENVAKVADASKVINETSNLSFWWAEKPNTSVSSAKLAEAKRFLAQDNFTLAADAAQAAIDAAANERMAFWNKVKSDFMLNGFLSIAKVFSDPEKYELKPVARPQFEWKAMPELIRIEFGKPIVDISDIVIEDPGTPIVPTFQPIASTTPITPQKNPVNFGLDPGTLISCGTTCRKTTATITNTGDETAHGVCVTLEIYNSNGEVISINGGASIQQCIGDLVGGQSRSDTVTINADCGFLYSKCSRPFTMKAKATYDDGKTFPFPDKQFS